MNTVRSKNRKPVALISVYHKDGIIPFAGSLVEMGWNLLASGGTKRELAGAGLPVRDIASLTGVGAIMNHRVVTLAPQVYGGILARPGNADDAKDLKKLRAPLIDMVCVDMYPLAAEIAKPGATMASVIEQTDIGGPNMARAAAKARRIVIVDPADRELVLNWIRAGQPNREHVLLWLAKKAESAAQEYARTSAQYLAEQLVRLYGANSPLAEFAA